MPDNSILELTALVVSFLASHCDVEVPQHIATFYSIIWDIGFEMKVMGGWDDSWYMGGMARYARVSPLIEATTQ